MIANRQNAPHYRWGDGCDGWHLVRAPQLSVIQERMPPGTQEARAPGSPVRTTPLPPRPPPAQVTAMRIPIDTFRLPNGLAVTLSEDHTAPIVAVNLWYHVGSANEREGRTGFAHLFEHMMFQGSANVPESQHFAHIEKAGGSCQETK